MKHDGDKPKLNEYQEGLMGLIESIERQYEAPGKKIHHTLLVGQARIDAAQSVWKGERGFSAAVLSLGWLLKIYFALVLYSYALHLRHGTYRKLPLSKPSGYGQQNGNYRAVRGQSFELGAVEDEEELPGWSDDEEDAESSKPSKEQSKLSTGDRPATTPNVESSTSIGQEISRPQSRSQVAAKRGSVRD
ncbi:hypothetical protein CBS101457_000450 [Exobasidium rhododendri]|nr:hypothetical protein CBS101457_000450 [Exobasidium rhododendri]